MEKRKENIFIAKFENFIIEKHGTELAKEIMESAYIRYAEISKENENNQIQHEYTRERIYAGIAIFDALIKNGRDREAAADLILLYYAWRSSKFGRKIKNLFKIPFLYRFGPRIFKKTTSKMFNRDAGFEVKVYETPSTEVRFDMLKCPYLTLCTKYNCKEIVKAYCYADVLCFGDLHEKLVFEHSKTLNNGDDSCFFRFSVKQ